MNIKISERTVVFKISGEELCRLLDGNTLEDRVGIGKYQTALVIECSNDTPSLALSLILDDKAEACYYLRVSPPYLQDLYDKGKNREGVSALQEGLEIFLQVDVRKDARAVDRN